jgi:hypothetical protein
MSNLRAIAIGSTGAVGREVLKSALLSPSFSTVLSAGRRPVPQEFVPAEGKEKLKEETIDFEKPDETKLKGFNANAVIIRYRKLSSSRRLFYYANIFLGGWLLVWGLPEQTLGALLRLRRSIANVCFLSTSSSTSLEGLG